MTTYAITLSETEDKALRFVAADPQDWIENAVKNRCRQVIDEIVAVEVARMMADPNTTQIPADREIIVMQADIVPAAERQSTGLPV